MRQLKWGVELWVLVVEGRIEEGKRVGALSEVQQRREGARR